MYQNQMQNNYLKNKNICLEEVKIIFIYFLRWPNVTSHVCQIFKKLFLLIRICGKPIFIDLIPEEKQVFFLTKINL